MKYIFNKDFETKTYTPQVEGARQLPPIDVSFKKGDTIEGQFIANPDAARDAGTNFIEATTPKGTVRIPIGIRVGGEIISSVDEKTKAPTIMGFNSKQIFKTALIVGGIFIIYKIFKTE